MALAYQSRQVVAMVVGDRTRKTCQKLWRRIPEAYRALYCFTDFWKAYQKVVPRASHAPSPKGSGRTNAAERFNLTF